MAYTEVDLSIAKKTLYRVAADNPNPAGSVTQNGFAILYASTSPLQPVAAVSVALTLAESQGNPLPHPELNDRNVWFIFQNGEVIGTVQAYSIDLATQPGKVIFYTEAGTLVASGAVGSGTAIIRADFLISPTINTFS